MSLQIEEIQAKSLLRKYKKIDSYFVARYGMNLYRGCLHACSYCDGRAEEYRLKGEFGSVVEVKVNAVGVLKRELAPRKNKKPLIPSYFLIGGGVGDSYQPIESKYNITRRVLELMLEYKLPIQILTKSVLIKRDIDIIKEINQSSRAIISFSFSSVDDKLSSLFEPKASLPSKRLEVMQSFAKEGISVGMYLMPIIPFITDKPNLIEDSIRAARDVGARFIIFSSMTLKTGRQMTHFYNILREHYPSLISEYNNIYGHSKWGSPSNDYYQSISTMVWEIAKSYKMPLRVPTDLYSDILDINDLAVVILEGISYMLELQGKKSPYGYSAYSISKLNTPINEIKNLKDIKGVGKVTERILLDIIKNRCSSYYDSLLNYV